MSVSLDALLSHQAGKAKSLSDRLDSGLAAVGAERKEEFSKYFDEAPVKAEKPAQEVKEKISYENKTLDDYRKEAQQFGDDAFDDIKEEYKESAPEAVPTQEKQASEKNNDSKKVLDNAEANVNETPKAASAVTEEIDAENAVKQTVENSSAEARGVEAILNKAATGSAEGEKLINPADAQIGKILARGQEIIQSQQTAGALILDQQEGAQLNLQQLASAEGQNNASENAQQTQFVNLAAIGELANEKQVNAQAENAVAANASNKAVNVARQSKLIAQQLSQAGGNVSEQALNVQNEKVQSSSVLSQASADATLAAQKKLNGQAGVEQIFAKLESAKQLQQEVTKGVQTSPTVEVKGQTATPAVNNPAQQLANQQSAVKQPDGALQKNAGELVNGQSLDGDAVLSAKTSENAAKPEMMQHVDGSKFKEYMKLTEVQGNTRTHANHAATKSESVVAQIKFGMAAAAAKGDKQVTIQLYPKELGTVDVHMKISATKGVEITMIADKSDTASMLQREAQNLKDALNDALKNQNTQLNFAFREDGGQSTKQGNSGFTMLNGERGLGLETEEEMIPLHQMQLVMEKGVDLVI